MNIYDICKDNNFQSQDVLTFVELLSETKVGNLIVALKIF